MCAYHIYAYFLDTTNTTETLLCIQIQSGNRRREPYTRNFATSSEASLLFFFSIVIADWRTQAALLLLMLLLLLRLLLLLLLLFWDQ